MLKVGVVGGTGYTGAELLRLLVMHPQVELSYVTSRVLPIFVLQSRQSKHWLSAMWFFSQRQMVQR